MVCERKGEKNMNNLIDSGLISRGQKGTGPVIISERLMQMEIKDTGDELWQLLCMSPHAINTFFHALMLKGMEYARSKRFSFTIFKKQGYDENMSDIVTDVDHYIHGLYVGNLRHAFPEIPVISEEGKGEGFADSNETYFVIDPLDGTRAFSQYRTNGVGSMIALVHRKQVLLAYVINMHTDDMIGFTYKPTNQETLTFLLYRVSCDHGGNTVFDQQIIPSPKPVEFSDTRILLRDREGHHSSLAQMLFDNFESVSVDTGGIGVWMSGLWMGEFGAALLLPEYETPWDMIPIVSISKELGFIFLRPNTNGDGWEMYDPEICLDMFYRMHETLIMHNKVYQKNQMQFFT